MNFQDKLIESATDLRIRAAALTRWVASTAGTGNAANRVARLKSHLVTLQVAGREFNKVAGRHLARFAKRNASLARDAGQEISALARSTYEQLSKRDAVAARKARKPSTRKRAATSSRARTGAKAA